MDPLVSSEVGCLRESFQAHIAFERSLICMSSKMSFQCRWASIITSTDSAMVALLNRAHHCQWIRTLQGLLNSRGGFNLVFSHIWLVRLNTFILRDLNCYLVTLLLSRFLNDRGHIRTRPRTLIIRLYRMRLTIRMSIRIFRWRRRCDIIYTPLIPVVARVLLGIHN